MNLLEENRLSWNQATKARNSHLGDQVTFFRNGGNTLFSEEQELLGDISDLRLMHLLCNSGQDTLSLARLGAIASGVDISDEAISFAEKLSQETGIPATFYRAEVMEWLGIAIKENIRFDRVFCSYGSLRWVPDLEQWTKGIASILEPGGRFVAVDFHPVAMMFNKNWHHAYPYPSGGKITMFEGGAGSDVGISSDGRKGKRPFSYSTGDPSFSNTYPIYTFDWGIGEIVTALAKAGMRVIAVKEYIYSRWPQHFATMHETSDGQMVPPPEVPIFPLLYGIAAEKN